MVQSEDESAVSNLVAAFENEINGHAKYKAFAQKAEDEGLFGAASLFRAAARAEQIHASNHARVIRQMGGEAWADIHPIQVRSTLDNLKTALGGELHEIDSLYPAFLKEATSHLDTTAVRTFIWAIEAEKTHARLYSDAVTILESGEANPWTESELNFYVCTLCGYTAETPEADNCPACNFVWDRFEVIR